MAAITRLDRGQFRVNFESLKRGLLPLSRRILFTGHMLQVDPQLILEAIRRVMEFCDLHDGVGRPLVWNEYKVFLSREDHEEFVHMEPVLFAQADELLDGYRKALDAEVIGDLTLRLLVDDGKALPHRVGVIQVATKVNRDLDEAQAQIGEITIRLPTLVPGPPPGPPAAVIPPLLSIPTAAPDPVGLSGIGANQLGPDTAGSPAVGLGGSRGSNGTHDTAGSNNVRPDHAGLNSAGDAASRNAVTPTGTQRVPANAENLTLTWRGGSAAIRPGVRWIVGRSTDPPVAEHCIPLPDASTRISSRAFWVEAKAEGATIGRFDHETANAVEVKGELLMRGGEIWVYEFPATIKLTSGEYELSLERH